jgi:hypothetical protein
MCMWAYEELPIKMIALQQVNTDFGHVGIYISINLILIGTL